MAIEFKLPELGENIEGGDVVKCLPVHCDSYLTQAHRLHLSASDDDQVEWSITSELSTADIGWPRQCFTIPQRLGPGNAPLKPAALITYDGAKAKLFQANHN